MLMGPCDKGFVFLPVHLVVISYKYSLYEIRQKKQFFLKHKNRDYINLKRILYIEGLWFGLVSIDNVFFLMY